MSGEHGPCRAVVAIGASGCRGLVEMAELLAELPAGFPAAVLLALHRPVDRPSHLAEVLQRATALPVRVAEHLQVLQPGTCYVGEPARHLTLALPGKIGLVDDPVHRHRNRTIDLLFRSVAEHAGSDAVGVVLSGLLSDGARGLAAIMAAGGAGMACTPSSHFEGDMPRNAIGATPPLAKVASAAELGQAIAARLHAPRTPAAGAVTDRRRSFLRNIRQMAPHPFPRAASLVVARSAFLSNPCIGRS